MKPSVLYWIVSVFLLLWGLAGASIYVALLTQTPEEFAEGAERPENREAYAEYIANMPAWAIGAGIIAAVARLLGALALLIRQAWAMPLYVVATFFFLVALFRAFILANASDVMSTGHMITQVVFIALSFFGIWFSHWNKSRGILK